MSNELAQELLDYIRKLSMLSEEELQKRIDERVIYCKHAPRKTPFGGCIGCKYEHETRKYVIDGICYHCPRFEPEGGWEEKIRRIRRMALLRRKMSDDR